MADESPLVFQRAFFCPVDW